MTKWDYLKKNYIDKNLKIFPIEPNGKKPLIENWMNECSSDYMQVLYWYTHCPNCNWGIPCSPNDLFVLDLDRHDYEKDGVNNFKKIIDTLPDDLYSFCIQQTPSNGQHLIFKTDDDLRNVCNGANIFKDYPGIDCRTDGYILIEPSVINNKPYKMLTEFKPLIMNKHLKEFVLKNANNKIKQKNTTYQKPVTVECGNRDNQLFMYITNLYYNTRLDFDEVLCLSLHFNDTVLEKPFSERTVKYKVNKIFERDRGTYFIIKINEE